ncbi:hypothetical protein F5Y10DRAFT_269819 [Nemania abortiva]|nr:hypothetical protein F5Y10DRAFT_269819 [Nemania abortiva]
MSYSQYLQAFRKGCVISLGRLCPEMPHDEIERIVRSVKGCEDCVLYWPLIATARSTDYHRGWCNAAFQDKATARRARDRLDGIPIGRKLIKASRANDPISVLDIPPTAPSEEPRHRKRPAVEDDKGDARKRVRLSLSAEMHGAEGVTHVGLPTAPVRSLEHDLGASDSVLLRRSTDPTKGWTEYYVCNPVSESNYLLVSKDDMMDTIQIKIMLNDTGNSTSPTST